jgi:hypothetical protein
MDIANWQHNATSVHYEHSTEGVLNDGGEQHGQQP